MNQDTKDYLEKTVQNIIDYHYEWLYSAPPNDGRTVETVREFLSSGKFDYSLISAVIDCHISKCKSAGVKSKPIAQFEYNGVYILTLTSYGDNLIETFARFERDNAEPVMAEPQACPRAQ